MKRLFCSLLIAAIALPVLTTAVHAHGLHAPAAEPAGHIAVHALQFLGLAGLIGGVVVWVRRRAGR